MKTVLISGGSSGIGRACAIKFAKEGFFVALNYAHNDDKAKEVENEIKGFGGEVELFKADVTNYNEVKKLVTNVAKTHGGVDVLINSAGMVSDAYLFMLSEKQIDDCLNLNVKSYFYLCQQAALKMFRKKQGVIINISSVSAEKAIAGQSVYAATKGAINSMTKVLATELAPYGIRVNAVAPGFVNTKMLEQIPEDKLVEYKNSIPMQRFCDAEEVGNAVFALSTDAFSYLTGQIITIDGGLSI